MSLHDIWRGDVMPQSGVAVAIGRNSFDPPAPVVPVFDIHARSLVMHDSGTDGSGILQYNGRQSPEGGRLELIPSMSGAQPIVTAILFDAYDTTGGTTVTTSLTTLNVDTERVNTHPAIYVLSSDTVQINQAGTYIFEFRASFDSTTTTRTNARTELQREPAAGGGFTAITASIAFSYHRTTANGEGTTCCKLILDDVLVGDTFRLQSIVINGTDITQLADATALTIRKLS